MSYTKFWNGEGGKANADIWFVHGLRGDKRNTWSIGDACWPRDYLKDDIPNSRIFTWGYDSSVLHLTKGASHATVFGHAESLLGDISETRGTSEEETRPLVFVGHSLGGLVIKEVFGSPPGALIRSAEYLHNKQDEELGSIYACTKGVVFLGTPHRGSDTVTYGKIVAKAAKLALRNPNDQLISMLEKESPILEHQRKSFASIGKDLALACVFEELPTALGIVCSHTSSSDGIQIVPQWSAVIDGFNVREQPVPANHMEMCKFATRDDVGYKRVIRLIKHVVGREFRALLSSLAFDSMNIRERDLDPAHRQTFEWILRGEEERQSDPYLATTSPFLEWLQAETPIFWLSGKPGSGKSTLMKFVATHPLLRKKLQPYFPGKRMVLVSHYLYERGDDFLQKSLEGLLRHLLHDILVQCPELSKTVFRLHGARTSFNYQKPWSWCELRKAFETVLAEKPKDVVIICVIDGLDEYRPMADAEFSSLGADLRDEEELSNIILDGHQAVADLMIDVSRYDGVKLFVSSRPFTVFRIAFSSFEKMELHTLTRSDISRYVADRLHGNQSLASFNADRPSFFKNVEWEILSKADGVFLWVRLVLDVFLRRLRQYDTAEELLQRIRDMPPKLGGRDGLYMSLLMNLSPRDRLEAYKYFQVILCSAQGLDPLLLSFALADPKTVFTEPMQDADLDNFKNSRAFCEDRVIARGGGLLEAKSNWREPGDEFAPAWTIGFIHLTAKEFVADSNNWRHILCAPEPPSFMDCSHSYTPQSCC
ncbi:SERAC1 protein [Apiospora saccharicola]